MSEGDKKKPVHIFRSTISQGSIKAHKERFGVSGGILTSYMAINIIAFVGLWFGGAGLVGFVFVHPVCGIFMLACGAVLISLWFFLVFRRKKPLMGAEGYFIEVFNDHLVLYGEKTDPRKIPFTSIKDITRFKREMTTFKDNDIDAELEQAKRPFIHIATNNANLYVLKYTWDGKEKESIIDIDNSYTFKDLVFKDE